VRLITRDDPCLEFADGQDALAHHIEDGLGDGFAIAPEFRGAIIIRIKEDEQSSTPTAFADVGCGHSEVSFDTLVVENLRPRDADGAGDQKTGLQASNQRRQRGNIAVSLHDGGQGVTHVMDSNSVPRAAR